MNDAVLDVDVRIFSSKDASKSNISSHHRWSAVDTTLYVTTPIKLILREKSIHSSENIVPCCCRMHRPATKKLLYYATSTYNCASDVISVDCQWPMLCKVKKDIVVNLFSQFLPGSFDSASDRVITKNVSSNGIFDCLLKDLTFKYLNETLKHRLCYDLILHVWSLFSGNNISCFVWK